MAAQDHSGLCRARKSTGSAARLRRAAPTACGRCNDGSDSDGRRIIGGQRLHRRLSLRPGPETRSLGVEWSQRADSGESLFKLQMATINFFSSSKKKLFSKSNLHYPNLSSLLGLEFRVWRLGSRDKGLGFRGKGLGFRGNL